MKFPWLVLLVLALAGCSDDAGDAGNDGASSADQDDPADVPASMPEPEPEELMAPEPATRWDNQTAVVGLADCTLIAALVSGGAPADAVTQAVSLRLSEEDWGREYEVAFQGDALSNGGAPASAPASICVGFDDFQFSAGASGTIPDGAEAMLIGGDALIQGDLSVRIGPEP
ncbi:MAG: hypothetical protein ACPHID_04360 [Thermoplasmatota archaeon]